MSKVIYLEQKKQEQARVFANLGFISGLMPLRDAQRYAKLLRRVGNVNVKVVKYG